MSSDPRIPVAGDGFYAAQKQKLARLEERYRHELLDVEERLQLRERVLRLRRKLSR